MILGIVGVVEVDVVSEKFSAHTMMAELVVHQRLPKRHDQMCSDGGYDK
jgi:hypothetical protein